MVNFICPIQFYNGNPPRLTSPFGWRTNPFGSNKVWHQGVDLSRTPNTNVEIVASADGEVIRAGVLGTYGYVVMIKHSIKGKRMDTNYAHLKAGSIKVKVGQKVKQGQVIGIMGSTGSSTAPHLHYEIHNGAWLAGQPNSVNPMNYISLSNSNTVSTSNSDKGELSMSQYKELNDKIVALQKELNNKQDKYVERQVSASHKEAWEFLKSQGITDGSNPQNYMSREQFATMLKRYHDKFIK